MSQQQDKIVATLMLQYEWLSDRLDALAATVRRLEGKDTPSKKGPGVEAADAVEAFAGQVYARAADALGWPRRFGHPVHDSEPPVNPRRAMQAVDSLAVSLNELRTRHSKLRTELKGALARPRVYPTSEKPIAPGCYVAHPPGCAPQAIEVVESDLPIGAVQKYLTFRRAGDSTWFSLDTFPTSTLFMGPISLRENP